MQIPDPDPQQPGVTRTIDPCGTLAGVMARTDVQRGMWKAPAGTAASLNGVIGLDVPMTDLENGRLKKLGVDCLRSFPIIGPVSWGARTLQGADRIASEWKYLPVRRLALFLEESLFRGTRWAVFEPNDEPLWASLRMNVGAFMNGLFRQGAFQGATAREALVGAQALVLLLALLFGPGTDFGSCPPTRYPDRWIRRTPGIVAANSTTRRDVSTFAA